MANAFFVNTCVVFMISAGWETNCETNIAPARGGVIHRIFPTYLDTCGCIPHAHCRSCSGLA